MKKFLSGLVAVAMMFSLAACSSSTEESSSSSSSAASSSAEGTSSGAEKFVIGGLGPLTGEAAAYGLSVKQGAEVAINEINAAGGVQVGDTTYELALNFLDDEASEDTQVDVNLPSISSGLLNSDVYNRYIMPIGSTTISASNGKLHNSYGYND